MKNAFLFCGFNRKKGSAGTSSPAELFLAQNNLQFLLLCDKMKKALPSKDESAPFGGDRRI